MNGFFNRLLRIDLTSKAFIYEELSDSVLAQTLGGKGLGTHLLLSETVEGIDPLSPESVFIIAVGPITGTKMWSQSRFGVFAKSPATNGYGESYCGGSLAPKIKRCGIDAVIIQGRCPSLSFLTIDETGVLFHDGGSLRGVETYETEQKILEKSGANAGAMVIGPAGENLVRFACIKSDKWRSLGRGGMGAVMGSKNLKGISFTGSKEAELSDPSLLKDIIRNISNKGKESPITAIYQKNGTPNMVAATNAANCFPTRYWQSGHFEHWRNLSADYMHEHFEVKLNGCPNCFLQCTKNTQVLDGRHKGLIVDGPEYETIYALGGLNCVDRLEEVAYLNDICDRMGLDTMSAGNITAFATEASRRGRIDFPIDYNQPDRMAQLLRMIADRDGIGDIFADGIVSAAQTLNMEDHAVHVKGLEPAGFEPRVLKGMGLSYATSARGACHLRGTFYKAELSGLMNEPSVSGRALQLIDYEDRSALFDSLILCRFFRDFILWDELALLIKATTGLDLCKEDLSQLANRITQQSRQYNHREGLDASSDSLPNKFLNEKTTEGAELREEELALMIGEYNDIREKTASGKK
jgi:aldehyde:ferredoxin oxidoreductase